MQLRNFVRFGCLPCLLLGLWSSPVIAANENERVLEAIKFYAPELLKERGAVKKFLKTKLPPPDYKDSDEAVLRTLMLDKTPMKVIVGIMDRLDDARDDAEIYKAIHDGGGGIPDDSPFWKKSGRRK